MIVHGATSEVLLSNKHLLSDQSDKELGQPKKKGEDPRPLKPPHVGLLGRWSLGQLDTDLEPELHSDNESILTEDLQKQKMQAIISLRRSSSNPDITSLVRSSSKKNVQDVEDRKDQREADYAELRRSWKLARRKSSSGICSLNRSRMKRSAYHEERSSQGRSRSRNRSNSSCRSRSDSRSRRSSANSKRSSLDSLGDLPSLVGKGLAAKGKTNMCQDDISISTSDSTVKRDHLTERRSHQVAPISRGSAHARLGGLARQQSLSRLEPSNKLRHSSSAANLKNTTISKGLRRINTFGGGINCSSMTVKAHQELKRGSVNATFGSQNGVGSNPTHERGMTRQAQRFSGQHMSLNSGVGLGRGGAHSRPERRDSLRHSAAANLNFCRGLRRCNTLGGGMDCSSLMVDTNLALKNDCTNATFGRQHGFGNTTTPQRGMARQAGRFSGQHISLNSDSPGIQRSMSGDAALGMMQSSVPSYRRTVSRTNLHHAEASLRDRPRRESSARIKRTGSSKSPTQTHRGSWLRLEKMKHSARDADLEQSSSHSQRRSVKKIDLNSNQEYTTVRRVKSAHDAMDLLNGGQSSNVSGNSNYSYHEVETSRALLLRSSSTSEPRSLTASGSLSLARAKRNSLKGMKQALEDSSHSKRRTSSRLFSDKKEPAPQSQRRSSSKHRSSKNLSSSDEVQAEQSQRRSRSKHRRSSKLKTCNSSRLLRGDEEPMDQSQKQHRPRQRSSSKLLSDSEEETAREGSSRPHRCATKQRAKRTASSRSSGRSKPGLDNKKKIHSSAPELESLAHSDRQGKERNKLLAKAEKEFSLGDFLATQTRLDSQSRWNQLDPSRSKLTFDTCAKSPNKSASSMLSDDDSSTMCSDDFSIPTIVSDKHKDGPQKSLHSGQASRSKLAHDTCAKSPNKSASSMLSDDDSSTMCSDGFSIPTIIIVSDKHKDGPQKTPHSGQASRTKLAFDTSNKSPKSSAASVMSGVTWTEIPVQSMRREAAASALQERGVDSSLPNGEAPDTEASLKAQRLMQLRETWKEATSQLVQTGS